MAEIVSINPSGTGIALFGEADENLTGLQVHGDVHIYGTGGAKAENHNDMIGYIPFTQTQTSLSTASSTTWRTAASGLPAVTCPPGRWILIGNAYFPSNSVGRRGVAINYSQPSVSFTTVLYTRQTQGALNGAYTSLNTSYILHAKETTTVYLNWFQNSGGNLTITGRLTAIRVR